METYTLKKIKHVFVEEAKRRFLTTHSSATNSTRYTSRSVAGQSLTGLCCNPERLKAPTWPLSS